MSCLKGGFYVSGSGKAIIKNREKRFVSRGCSSVGSLQFKESKLNDFWRKSLEVSDQRSRSSMSIKAPMHDRINVQSPVLVSKSLRWWEKSLQPNMIEMDSAQELVDYLLIAGDRLVVIDFYSPGCGGCKALHPKICQMAELNPDSTFLKINYEQHKAMCYALNVHVLPFFRFYRGAEGRLCSFSCTNATIKKFKDSLAKHGTDRCSLGPAMGLNDSELLALQKNGQISRNLIADSAEDDNEMGDFMILKSSVVFAENENGSEAGKNEDKSVLMA